MDEFETIHLFGFLCHLLPVALAGIAAAGFGLATRDLPGKLWIAIGGFSLSFRFLWWSLANLLATVLDEPEIPETLSLADPLVSLLGGIGWAGILLFVASQHRDAWRGYGRILFSFSGRISRLQFWICTIALNVVSYLSMAPYLQATASTMRDWRYSGEPENLSLKLGISVAIMLLWSLLSIWPSLAIQVKRWHDRDKSGWMVLINLIPIVGPIWALVELGILPGSPGTNQFGDSPIGGRPAVSPAASRAEVKVCCPHCEQHVMANLDVLTSGATCPTCQRPLCQDPAA